MRHATKKSVLQVLRKLGIATAIDVGVERCTQSLMDAFPDAKHVLVESDYRWFRDYPEVYSGLSFEDYNWFANSTSRRVDSIDCNGPVLIKVDVDGPEMDVLAGCTGLFPKVSAIIVEATMDKLFEILFFAERHGFKLFDVVDLCYCGPQLHQVDLVFVHSSVESKIRVDWDLALFQDSSLTVVR